jgi:hypothetical protein
MPLRGTCKVEECDLMTTPSSIEGPTGQIVLTGEGFRIAASVTTVFFLLGTLGCLVGAGFVVSRLVRGTGSTGGLIGFLILWLFGVMLALISARITSRNIGRCTSFDREGISGLAVLGSRRTHPKVRHRLFPVVDRSTDLIPWRDIESSAVFYVHGSEGGGTYRVRVHLKDGRKGTVYAWSLRKSTMDRIVEQLELARQYGTMPVLTSPPESRSLKYRLGPRARSSRYSTLLKISLWIVVAIVAITAIAVMFASFAPSPGNPFEPVRGAVVGVPLLLAGVWMGWYAIRIPRRRRDLPHIAVQDSRPRR